MAIRRNRGAKKATSRSSTRRSSSSTRYSSSSHPQHTFYMKGYEVAKDAFYKGATTKKAAAALTSTQAWFDSSSAAGKAFREGFDVAWSNAETAIRRRKYGVDVPSSDYDLRWNRGKKKARTTKTRRNYGGGRKHSTKTVYYWKAGSNYVCRPTSTGVVKFDSLKALKTYMAHYFGERYSVKFEPSAQSEARVAANPRRGRKSTLVRRRRTNRR